MLKAYCLKLILITILLSSCSKETIDDQDNIQLNIKKENEEATSELNAEPTESEVQLFTMINDYRIDNDQNALDFDAFTYIQAEKHNDYMISKANRSHDHFEERAAEIAAKVGAKYVAENLASDYQSIENAFDDWLVSPGHRKNIEGDFTHAGLSVKADANGILYFTQIFYR